MRFNETCDTCYVTLRNTTLTMTGDSLTRRRSCPCTERHSAQCCCCSHFLGPGSTGSRSPVDKHEWKHQKKTETVQKKTNPQARQRNPVFGTNLQDIVPRFHICDIDPLTVDLSVVGVVTPWTQALHVADHHVHLWHVLLKRTLTT